MTVSDPERLKRELLLRSVSPAMPQAAKVLLVDRLREREVPAGQTFLEIGDAPDHFMFLAEGRVVMERPGYRPWEFVPFAVVGVIDAILQRSRTRSARALEPSRLLTIQTNDWIDMLQDNGQVARAAIRNFATGLHARWRVLAPRLQQRWSESPPDPLPTRFEVYDKILTLRRAPFLRSAGMQAVASLAGVAHLIALEPGQLLFDIGQSEENLYVVASGALELTSNDPEFRWQHRAGDLVGGAAALCRSLPNYAARAIKPSLVLRITEHDFYDQAEEHGRLSTGTMAYLFTELEPMLEIEDASIPAAPGVGPPLRA